MKPAEEREEGKLDVEPTQRLEGISKRNVLVNPWTAMRYLPGEQGTHFSDLPFGESCRGLQLNAEEGLFA
jgi:hypothetical protein